MNKETLRNIQANFRCANYEQNKEYYKANEKKAIICSIIGGLIGTAYMVGLIKFVNADFEEKEE